MPSTIELQSRVGDLALVNVQLDKDVSELVSCHERAETRLESETEHLKGLLFGTLPGIVTILSKEIQLPSQGTIQAGVHSTLPLVTLKSSEINTTDALTKAVQHFETANNRLKEAEEEARENRVGAAELASRAAVQTVNCASSAQLVEDEQQKTSEELDKAHRSISSAHQKITENEQLYNSMEANVNHHQQEIDNLGGLWWTGFIPVVNIITMPIMFCGQSEHGKKRDDCKEVQRLCQEEIDRCETEKYHIQSQIEQLNIVSGQLHDTMNACSNLKSNSESLKERSKYLTDQYGLLISNVGQVIAALDILNCSTDDAWDRYRFKTLHCIRTMLSDLDGTKIASREISQLIDLVDQAHPKVVTELLDW